MFIYMNVNVLKRVENDIYDILLLMVIIFGIELVGLGLEVGIKGE